jgi:predicted RecB family nuclease
MHQQDGKLIFSPSDLTNYMESKFVSFMDRLSLQQDPRAIKDAPDESMQIIRDRGMQHEQAYLALLKEKGHDVCEIPDKTAGGIELTLEAIKAGRQIIYQAHLSKEQFFGKCDFLVRVDDRSSKLLGSSYSYEPYDTKLALKPKPYFAVQLCAYAEMLELVQGILPEQFVIILGDKTPKSFRTEDYIYFYRQLKKEFVDFHDKFDGSEYPEEIDLPPFCQWKRLGEDILEKRDDLCRIANIRKSQIVKLKRAGINTLTQLAQTSKPSIGQMSSETFTNLKEQADLQLRSKGLDRPLYTMLPIQVDKQRHGLALLPPTSPNDVFFDMEGYPLKRNPHSVKGSG